MKSKKILSIMCAASLLFMSGMPVNAKELSDPAEISTEETKPLEDTISLDDISSPVQTDNAESAPVKDISDIGLPEVSKASSASLEGANVNADNLASAVLLEDMTSKENSRSVNSVTQQFTDYITAEGDSKYVQFSLNEGEIFNATLACPNNAALDYDLVLASVAADGSLTIVNSSSLGTYIDPDTGKTVDEGISFIHNQGTTGDYAIFVMATTGSSTTSSFTLTISLDTPGSYDSNEPNDSPFDAKSISSLDATGSLHVVNDQDWYAVNLNTGVYTAAAGNYKAEIYKVTTGNIMVKAPIAGKTNYVLDSGLYFVKVYYSDAPDTFTFGDYTLQISEISKYATMQTAYNYGNWESSYSRFPGILPSGQQQAYYKFNIDSGDRAYSSMIISDNSRGLLVELLNSAGKTINYGFTGDPAVTDIPVRGMIRKNNLNYLVVNINGVETGTVAYLKVTKVDPFDFMSGGSPNIHNRINTGRGTFSVSGTAKNAGYGYSSVLSINLTNNSNIPQNAVVDDIMITGSMSSNVGGVEHLLNPGGIGWVAATSSLNGTGNFYIGTSYNIPVKQAWQYRYYQSAFKATDISRIKMEISWEYDMANTNYDLFQ